MNNARTPVINNPLTSSPIQAFGDRFIKGE